MIFMVAVVKDAFKNTLGYRLLDTDTKQVMETQKVSVIMAMKQGQVRIENLEIDGDNLVGYNGSIDRYPVLNQHLQLIGKSPVIILYKTDERTFVCCDFKGEIITIDEARLMQYAVAHGIANGKIAKGHIAAIEGLYEVIPTMQNKQGEINRMSNQTKRAETQSKPMTFTDKLREYTRNRQLLGESGGVIKFKPQGKDVSISEVDNTITAITIPDFVTKIDNNVFYLCYGLKRITILGNIKEIGSNAFPANNSIKFHIKNTGVGMLLLKAGINKNQITLEG